MQIKFNSSKTRTGLCADIHGVKMAITRLTDEELLALLNDIESDRCERKAGFTGDVPRKARQVVCAFANDLPDHKQPGVLFIGAKDDGEPGGLQVTEQLLQSLANMKTDGKILPMPALSVDKRTLKGGTWQW